MSSLNERASYETYRFPMIKESNAFNLCGLFVSFSVKSERAKRLQLESPNDPDPPLKLTEG